MTLYFIDRNENEISHTIYIAFNVNTSFKD
jgi:hypothetical protein